MVLRVSKTASEINKSQIKVDSTTERFLFGSAGKEVPRDGEDTLVVVAVVEGTEKSGGHVKITIAAPRAQVNDLSDLLIAVLFDVSDEKDNDGKIAELTCSLVMRTDWPQLWSGLRPY